MHQGRASLLLRVIDQQRWRGKRPRAAMAKLLEVKGLALPELMIEIELEAHSSG